MNRRIMIARIIMMQRRKMKRGNGRNQQMNQVIERNEVKQRRQIRMRR